MKSLWSDAEAKSYVARYGDKGIAPDLALRVYTTRLLGGDPALVLHGGGNTSVKTQAKDLLGDDVDVICVKGSGWDMGDIEPPGLPAVKLAPLRRLLRAAQAVRRGHGQLSAHQSARFSRAQSVGRDAAARLPAAQIRRSHALDRGARAHRPARRRGDSRATRSATAWPMCRTRFRASRSPRASREIYAANPKVEGADPAAPRHLHLRRRRARSL